MKQRLTFREIVAKEQARMARTLEDKARMASWLAKAYPRKARAFYLVKHAAVRQLFRVPNSVPIIRDAWGVSRGILLSVKLVHTNSLLHVPFEELMPETQQTYVAWVSDCARRKRWQPVQTVRCPYRSFSDAA